MGSNAILITTVTNSHCFKSMIQGPDAYLQNATRSVAFKALRAWKAVFQDAQDEELKETTKLDIELAKLAGLPNAETKDILQSDMKEIR
ncbi:hypothetical protein N7519_006075 [Penicillium mononematosum]|uniref:uncharacterized protein n=1 Tax=Penicillium mononematosum TaxID=268346 RepID=UPI00254872C8|nr:uncharacterized protein N7519_006075 [Penicillium mononematosum]KAJ6184774.1 hypothetical protein N7519_006075 [Penicillium mononematosum]